MPSPSRSDDSKIAYTRWEPLSSTEDAEVSEQGSSGANNNNTIPFHHFEEEGISIIHRRSPSSLKTSSLYDFGIKTLGIFIIIGISWIIGFMTRWGVHHYYVDSIGHCITPVPYHYDPETARLILEEIDSESIKNFLHDFTSAGR